MAAHPLLPRPEEPDPNAFEQLVATHQAAIWRYLRFLGCSVDEADELTQDTFVAVVDRCLHRFGPAGARAYLRRVARNAFLRLRRLAQDARTTELDEADAAFDWFQRSDDGEAVIAALRQCLATLDERARSALTMRYVEQLDRHEIGRRLQIGSHGVKSLLQRNYARLRACLQRRLEDD